MKVFKYKNRSEYVATQIERSKQKFEYCKVYFSDVIRYRQLVDQYSYGFWGRRAPAQSISRILCLGVRGGAEVDIFRTVFFAPLLRYPCVQTYLRKADVSQIGADKTRLAKQWGLGSGRQKDGRVVGVEITPSAERQDIWNGSFDELPEEWSSSFNLIYSNSIDHSQDPERTVAEWKRVAAPGAFVILAFTQSQEVSDHDPFGGFSYDTLQGLWQAPVIFTGDVLNQNGYKEICFRLAS